LAAAEIKTYLGLGSNLGDKQKNITQALNHLRSNPYITLIRHSSIYLTEPVGASRQPDFFNCAVEIKTTLFPHSLLEAVKLIEADMKRPPDNHFQPRPIDIDILLYGSAEIDSLDLMIPHSRLTKRAFVLTPLLEMNPELVHPVSFKLLKEYLIEIKPPQKVERIVDAGDIAKSSKKN